MISTSRGYHFSMVTDSKTFAILATLRCLLVFAFFGFGLTLMGIIMTAVSYNDPFQDDPFFNKHPNPIKTVGPIFITIGLLLVLTGVIIGIIAYKKGHRYFGNTSVSGAVNANATVHPPYMGSNVPYPENIQGQQSPYNMPPNAPYPPSNAPYPANVPPPGFRPDLINQPYQPQQQAATYEFPQNDMPPPYNKP